MRVYPSLLGERFGNLVIEKQLPSSEKGQRQWLCRCDCGNTHISNTTYLKRGHATSCGCKKSPDLTGRVFGRLTVIGRSDKRGSRGNRTTPLWKCRCECGAITYKATDTLTNSAESMCVHCAGKYSSEIARRSAGFIDGTQVCKIRNATSTCGNTSGRRGVYYNKKTNKYRARITFKGKRIELGSYSKFEDAVKARERAEIEYFESFLLSCDSTHD